MAGKEYWKLFYFDDYFIMIFCINHDDSDEY